MDADPRLAEAQAKPILDVVHRLAIPDLKRAGHEMVGPCPVCGGRDRFSINADRAVFNCRHCGGGDVIKLVQLVQGCDFKDALTWLVGEADVQISPEEQRRRDERSAAEQIKRTQRTARERAKSIVAARGIWAKGRPAPGSLVSDYLAARGMPDWLSAAPPACLRFHPALRYVVPSSSGRGYETLHTGPAMLAAIVAPDGSLIGVHRTWIDPGQPKGKALIVGPDGDRLQVKKILGSKKGGAIRLAAPQHFDTLIMGEGIETTLSARAAMEPLDHCAFWAGVDLGNMAGRRILRGKGMKYRGIPDLDDSDAFVPPPWIKRLIFLQDGDSDARTTRAKLLSGLRRAKHHNPDLCIQIAHPGDGVDLNDMLMDEGPDDD